MKVLLTVFVLVLSANALSAQETKTITGRIISEELEPLPEAKIYNMDTTILGSTNKDGYFEIEVPVDTDELLLGFIGMEWTSVRFEDDCQNLEMIMMLEVIYDFVSANKANRKRRKRFKQLPKKHLAAYEKGIFENKTSCVCYIFKEY